MHTPLRDVHRSVETIETVSRVQPLITGLMPAVKERAPSPISVRGATFGAGRSPTPNFSWVWRDQQHIPNGFNNLVHRTYKPINVPRPGLGRVVRDLLLLGLCAVLSGPAFAALKTGENFPDLSSFKLEGKLPDTAKAKVVMVDFWASWCEPCKQSFPVMEDLHQRYSKDGLVIIAVNVDENRADMEAFLKKNSVTFAVLRDANQKLVERAGVATMPSSFLIDKDGKVRFLHNGFRGAETKKKYDEEIQSLLK